MSFVSIPRSLLLPLSILAVALPLRAQGSDSCSTAQAISGPGPHAFDLTNATTGTDGQGNAACDSNGSTAIENDVWYHWSAPVAGTYVLTTCLQTIVDTKVAIYGGNTCPPGAPVSCNDDGGGVQTVARFVASAGQPFTFQVGKAPFSSAGTGTFRVLLVASGFADDCNTPDLAGSTGMFAFDNTLASTGTQGQSNPGCVSVRNDLWFVWTPSTSGMAVLNTCGQTTVDTNIAVYAGSGCPVNTSLACDDDGCALQSTLHWAATGGTPYMLQIGSSGGLSGGWGTFDIEITPTPANDDCASPASANPGGATYDNSTATTGSQGQTTSCGAIHNDLWYTWTAPSTGTVTIETCGQTAENTILAVYPGSGCPSAAAITCNDDACGGVTSQVVFAASAGATYTIQLGNFPGAPPGPGSFTIVESSSGGPVTAYCFGDGSGTPCPCGNVGLPRRGCPNSVNSSGAKLEGSGAPVVSSDTFVLRGSGMPPGSTAVFFQALTQVNNGNGSVLGDGLRCATGSPVRLGYKINSALGESGYGGPLGDIPISVRGAIPPVGATRQYQLYYRNPAPFCTSATYNLTNGLEVVWSP